jgi:hypothetical protein
VNRQVGPTSGWVAATAAQTSYLQWGPVGFRRPERLFDANPKRRYLAAQRIELRVQLLILDTPDHFAERSFKSLQDAGDEQWMKRHN